MAKRIILFVLLLCTSVCADTVTLPTTYQTGGTVTATNLNANFNAITAQVNGGLSNDNADTTAGYRFYETKTSLPSAGDQGRVVFETSSNTLNIDTGAAWQAAVFPSGTLATGKIPYYSSGWQLLTPGTANYALVSNGTSSNPSYQLISLTAGVTGTLPVANGGTGQVTAQAAIDALLPSQTGNSGKVITTNGTTSSWGSFTRVEVFTTSGTWTCPTGVNAILVSMVGGGAGGGAAQSGGSKAAGGGGAGAYVEQIVLPVVPTTTYTVTIGSGGNGASSSGATGSNGNNTSMVYSGGTLIASGGSAGVGSSGSGAGGAGGTTTWTTFDGTVGSASGTGGAAGIPRLSAGGNGGNGGSTTNDGGGAGGSNPYGRGGVGGNDGGSTPGNGTGYGAGGGGCGDDCTTAGNGSAGIVIIEYNANGAPS